MSDSIDRVFAHALSTVRKLPNTGSARPPTADRLRLYGLYKQSMEGDVEGVMARPSGTSAEEQAEAGKWDAWRACAGQSRTEAKRRYIAALIDTMHRYATSTPSARALVEELEFVWDQVRGNWTPEQAAAAGGAEDDDDAAELRSQPRLARVSSGRSSTGGRIDPATGLRIVRPVSDNDAASQHPPMSEDEDAMSHSSSVRHGSHASSLSGSAPRDHEPDETAAAGAWRRRVTHALMQLTAEVSALRELADGSSTSTLGRYFARSRRRRRGLVWRAMAIAWALAKRVAIDAAVVALVVLVLRWRWRERVEGWWELLGVWMGFVGDEVRGRVKSGVREGIKMGRGVRAIAGAPHAKDSGREGPVGS